MSIRARLLLLILFATLIPALVGGFNYLDQRESQLAQANRELAGVTRQVAQALTETVRSTAQLHYGLSRARDFDTQDRTACSDFLAGVLREHPQYTGILTIKPDGELFCDSLRTQRTLNLTDRRYFQSATRSNNPLAVEPVFGRLTGFAVLQIAYGVRDEKGATRFVLLASLDLEKYMRARALTLFPLTASIALIDGKGTILTWYPGGEKMRGTPLADKSLAEFVHASRDVSVRENADADGNVRIWAASTLPEFEEAELHVLVGVSKNDLLAQVNRKMYASLATLAAIWLLVFSGAWALAELAIRRQLARIITPVSRLGAGDLTARIGAPYPRGEIGELMAALDHAFGLIASQRDEIHQLNADLERRVTERTTQLEATVKELESFTYSVSHDLRGPLRAIDGFSNMLSRDYAGKLDEEGVRRLKVICGNSIRMGKLIDDLLNFSRIGREPLSTGVVDMNALVAEVIEEYRRNGETMPQLIVGDLPPARGDTSLLKQVWINLLGNAIKFSGKVERPLIEINGHTAGEECVYCVKDNGAGFDMRYYQKLFGVFQRLHGGEEFAGTGVGLAIVQRIVVRHGGKAWAAGKIGDGASFSFSLRATGSNAQSAGAASD